ncbi:MAG: hypothetical protein PVJ55_01060 [Anaerolineae bacterium]|jgi:anti-sigma factor RsiW
MLSLFGRTRDEEERLDEQLSAYLDGEMSEHERQRFETRLSQDPELRAELRTFNRTVSLVRELPEVSAPRNFILSETMVKRERLVPEIHRARRERQRGIGAWAAPLLTGAATVVSLLFVVVVVGDLLLPAVGGRASAPAPMLQRDEAPEMAPEAAVTPETEPMESGAADLASPPPTSAAPPAKEAIEEPEMPVEEEGAATEAERAMEAPAGAGGTPPPVAGGGATEEPAALLAPKVTVTTTWSATMTATIPAEPPAVSEGELGLVEPTPDELPVTPEPVQGERETGGFQFSRLPLRALEVMLGLASLVLTVATIQAWRLRYR